MIEVQDLHFTYPRSHSEAVRGLSFAIERGEIFGFLGPSGAGKSTTQKVLIGILHGYHGSVNVMGKDLADHTSDYYESIGVSFEFPNVYSRLTGAENLAFFASLYSGRTADPRALLDVVGLTADADNRVEHYSKGMQMRLNFCRALLNQPEILFLDEPTSGQDPVNARRVKDIILNEKASGRTVFLTTHDMSAATELCDRVAFIVDGRIVMVDAPHELMIHSGRHVVRVEFVDDGTTSTRDFDLTNLGSNGDFLELIRNHAVRTIHSLEASLEDVFIEVTGQRLS
jgi:fluoroquinolone transport system ATP-binding protein